MRFTICTWGFLACLTFLVSCTQTNGLSGQVTMDEYEGKQVYLETTDYQPVRVDSATVTNGRFEMPLNDSTPQVYTLILGTSADDPFPITLPVVSEKGAVKVVMGELVLTMGTPMNDSLQDFLLEVSQFTDALYQQEQPDMEKVKTDFAQLVKDAILRNIQTPVGAYIYRMYQEKLDETQKTYILNQADEAFKAAI